MANVATSRVMNKIKKTAGTAWRSSREKAAQVKGQRLPGGIVGGIARFADYAYGETDDKKVPYLRLTFVVDEPSEYGGVKQSLSYFFQDSKFKSLQEVLDRLSSDLQLMGHDVSNASEDDWEAMLADSKANETPIEFNTRSGKTDDGRDWMSFDIQGVAEDYTPPEPAPQADPGDPANEPAADGGQGDGDGTATDAGEWQPEDGDVYLYRNGPKAKKEEHTVTSVYPDKQTVDLKRDRDGREFKAVSWDKLEGE